MKVCERAKILSKSTASFFF